MRIALALSGGGFRASVFHLGVLARLAEDEQLEDITYLSTVSGGSLAAGLVFALNDYRWPSSQEYQHSVLPAARNLLMTKDLKQAMLARVLTRFLDIMDTRADDLSALMQEHWGIKAALKDLPSPKRMRAGQLLTSRYFGLHSTIDPDIDNLFRATTIYSPGASMRLTTVCKMTSVYYCNISRRRSIIPAR